MKRKVVIRAQDDEYRPAPSTSSTVKVVAPVAKDVSRARPAVAVRYPRRRSWTGFISPLFHLILLGGVIWGGVLLIKRQLLFKRQIEMENAAVARYNQANWNGAFIAYQHILQEFSSLAPDVKARVIRQMALCCKNLGDDPKLSLAKQVTLYRRALALDPGITIEPGLRRLLNSKTPASPATRAADRESKQQGAATKQAPGDSPSASE